MPALRRPVFLSKDKNDELELQLKKTIDYVIELKKQMYGLRDDRNLRSDLEVLVDHLYRQGEISGGPEGRPPSMRDAMQQLEKQLENNELIRMRLEASSDKLNTTSPAEVLACMPAFYDTWCKKFSPK